MTVAFDIDRMEVYGETAAVVDGVVGSAGTSAVAHFATSNDGTLVYVPGVPGGVGRELVWVDESGNESDVGAPPGDYWFLDLSPTGDMIAVTRIDEGARDIYTWDLNNPALGRLTNGGMDFAPRFSRDGSTIAFASDRDDEYAGRDVYVIPRNSATGGRQVVGDDTHLYPMSWTADGGLVLMSRGGVTTSGGADTDNVLFYSAGGGTPEPLVAEPGFSEESPALSPDEHWLAYVSNDSGEQVWIRRFPGPSGRSVVSPAGCPQPALVGRRHPDLLRVRWCHVGSDDGALRAADGLATTTALRDRRVPYGPLRFVDLRRASRRTLPAHHESGRGWWLHASHRRRRELVRGAARTRSDREMSSGHPVAPTTMKVGRDGRTPRR